MTIDEKVDLLERIVKELASVIDASRASVRMSSELLRRLLSELSADNEDAKRWS